MTLFKSSLRNRKTISTIWYQTLFLYFVDFQLPTHCFDPGIIQTPHLWSESLRYVCFQYHCNAFKRLFWSLKSAIHPPDNYEHFIKPTRPIQTTNMQNFIISSKVCRVITDKWLTAITPPSPIHHDWIRPAPADSLISPSDSLWNKQEMRKQWSKKSSKHCKISYMNKVKNS